MKDKLLFIISMMIFGSIGLIVRGIPLTSAQIAMIRGVIGSIFLIITGIIMNKKPSFKAIKKNITYLLISGGALGFNWILLFESYRHTSIANATLSYYFAPVIIVLLSPFLLKEKISLQKILSILVSMTGMFLLVWTGGKGSLYSQELIGIGFGLSAAVLYAMVVIMNKIIKDIGGLEVTIIQLTMASIILIPYVLSKDGFPWEIVESKLIIQLALVGLFNTGIAYLLYFSSVQKLDSQTVAILSYIDPISALVMSAIFIGEKIGSLQLLGGILILGGAFFSGKDKNHIRSSNS